VRRIKRVRRQLGLRGRRQRKFRVTTESRHGLPAAENPLGQLFEAAAPSQAWLSDITYVATDEGGM
jgi:putative transposase